MKKIEVKRRTITETTTPACTIMVGNKEIRTPLYGVIIRKHWELDLICDNFNISKDSFSAVVFPAVGAKNIIANREKRLRQSNLFYYAEGSDVIEKEYQYIKKNALWFANPNWSDRRSPQEWKDFTTKPKHHIPAIMENLMNQSYIKPDFYVPEVPMISANDPQYLISCWSAIVKTTGNIAENNFDSPIAIPLFLDVNNFRNGSLLEGLTKKLSEYLRDEEKFAESSLILLQIHGIEQLESDTGAVKLNFRDFTTGLAQLAVDTEKALLLLNANSEGYFSLANGINGFVEPLNGVLGGFARSQCKYGKYYHREEMKFFRYASIETIVKNKGRLPCSCEVCERLSKRWGKITQTEWNHSRRLHLLACRKDEMEELKANLNPIDLRMGLIDKINRSGLKNLAEAFNL